MKHTLSWDNDGQYKTAVKLYAGIEDVKLDVILYQKAEEDGEDAPDALGNISIIGGVTEDSQ